jgi:hypothetical protein
MPFIALNLNTLPMNAMLPLVEAQDPAALEAELVPERLLRTTNKGNNLLYVVNAGNAPACLQEIGRLRELSFRAEGGGTGMACDLDSFDLDPQGYEQLLVWDPENRQIMAAYRFVECRNTGPDSQGDFKLSSGSLFAFSDDFCKNVLPYTIELGRAFVTPDYQPNGLYRKGIFALDNLWDGLGALTVVRQDIRYLYGKVTVYGDYPPEAMVELHSFMTHFFGDSEGWVIPRHPLALDIPLSPIVQDYWSGLDYEKALVVLNKKAQEKGCRIPPLFPAYMNLSSTMRYFGFAHNASFGKVDEAGILVTIADINASKTERHIRSYTPPQT